MAHVVGLGRRDPLGRFSPMTVGWTVLLAIAVPTVGLIAWGVIRGQHGRRGSRSAAT